MRIKSKTGFVGGGLLGVLGFSLVGLTIAMGNYKLNTRSINSTNVESVASSEKALGKTLINILNNDDYCRQYLTGKPEERISVLNVGNFKNEGFINIIDIDVLPTNAPPFPKKKTLYVYYKKPALGANEIRQGKHDNNQPYKCEPDDENSNKKGDKRGCYHVSCEINYTCSKADRNSNTDCSNDDDPSNIITSCAPANCFPKKPEPKISSCDPNEIKTGITPCDTIPANIFNSDEMRQLNPDTTQTIKAFTGFKTSESRIKPDAIEVSKTCPEGQYPVRKTDGTTVCQIMCTGGSILTNTNPPLCVCPDDKPIYKQGVCQRCPTSFIWNPDLEGGPGCDCPSNHHLYIKNGVADVSHAPLAVIQGHIGVMVNVYVMIQNIYGFMNLTESISAIVLLENIFSVGLVYHALTEHGMKQPVDVIALGVELGTGRGGREKLKGDVNVYHPQTPFGIIINVQHAVVGQNGLGLSINVHVWIQIKHLII